MKVQSNFMLSLYIPYLIIAISVIVGYKSKDHSQNLRIIATRNKNRKKKNDDQRRTEQLFLCNPKSNSHWPILQISRSWHQTLPQSDPPHFSLLNAFDVHSLPFDNRLSNIQPKCFPTEIDPKFSNRSILDIRQENASM